MLSALVITTLVQAMVVVAIIGPAVGAPVIGAAMPLPESAVGVYIALAYLDAMRSALCTGVQLGSVAAGLVVPPLRLMVGWQQALLALAASCVLIAMLPQHVRAQYDSARSSVRDSARAPNGSTLVGGWRGVFASFGESIRMVSRHPELRRLTFCALVFAGLQLSLTTYLVSYLNPTLGWSLVAEDGALSATLAAGVLGRIGWGAVSDAGLGTQRTPSLLPRCRSDFS